MATILVIDDERMICDLLRAVFSAHGHEVLTATSGREGLELFRQRKPRFTLLDLAMPGMDGIEVLQEIRKINPDAPVIVLTGGDRDALEIRARGLGVTDFLRKGLPLEVLIKTMDRAMQRSGKVMEASASAVAVGGAPSDGPAALSVLVVDDEPQIRSMLSQFLTRRGYLVRVAPDGPTALAMFEQERPRFVILDMYMPGMNGLEMLREMRARKYEGGVLGLTGSQDENLLQGVLDLGAVDVMGKPVDLEKVELAVQLGCILTAP
ncbi:MAG: response regulator [Nitrospiraceae bacterium]|nr:MAG: response regulator [Nitrospiraceae bacterium]